MPLRGVCISFRRMLLFVTNHSPLQKPSAASLQAERNELESIKAEMAHPDARTQPVTGTHTHSGRKQMRVAHRNCELCVVRDLLASLHSELFSAAYAPLMMVATSPILCEAQGSHTTIKDPNERAHSSGCSSRSCRFRTYLRCRPWRRPRSATHTAIHQIQLERAKK